MISFIIIGRNEGWKLTKCLESVFKTIRQNILSKYEVIYVDSKSTDDSIERAKCFKNIKIIQLTGEINAAIGRNVGAQFAKGDVLFFIDGDMEIMPDFLPKVYSETYGLKYDFVSGQMNYIYYDRNNKYIGEELYYKRCLKKDAVYYTVGGLFLIRRKCWDLVGGMKNKYKKSQDYDLALRLSKENIHLFRKKELIGNTHMISYKDSTRMYMDILNSNNFYPRSLIYREHLFYKHMWPVIIRNDSSLLIFLILLLASLFSNNYIFLVIYPFYIIIRILKRKRGLKNLFINIPYYILRDLTVIFGFLFFYPKEIKKSEITYKVLN